MIVSCIYVHGCVAWKLDGNTGFKSMIAGGMRIWIRLMGFQEIKNRGKLYEMYYMKIMEISQAINYANKGVINMISIVILL